MEELGPHGRFIDTCMKPFIKRLIQMGFVPLACCCGHGKYRKTIVLQGVETPWEYRSGKQIRRKRNFYKQDAEGLYYIPEVKNGP
jgi:hypothetical protein